jgi:hypothetical protein
MSPRNRRLKIEAWTPPESWSYFRFAPHILSFFYVADTSGRTSNVSIRSTSHSFVFSILFQLTFPFFHVVCCFVLSFFLCGKKFLIYPLLPHRPPHPKEYQPLRGFNHVPWILSHLDDMVAIFCRHASLGFLLSLAPSTP